MAADDIRAMSEALAADPGSLVFLPLGEALLARGEYSHAERVAQRGAVRHPQRGDAHDLVARIALAQGDDDRALNAWETVLELSPSFGTAHRGLGFIMYRRGWLTEALGHLQQADRVDPDDESVQAAIDAVRTAMERARATSVQKVVGEMDADVLAAASSDDIESDEDSHGDSAAAPPSPFVVDEDAPHIGSPDTLFDEILGDTAQVALLLEADGVVAAGRYVTTDGSDLGAMLGAHLSGVSDEAERAMRHFGLGKWTRIVLETEVAVIAVAPTGATVTLVAAPREIPLGFVRRTLDRCSAAARSWLESWDAQ